MWAFALILVFFVSSLSACLPACLPVCLSVCLSGWLFYYYYSVVVAFAGNLGRLTWVKRPQQRYPAIPTSDKCMQYFHLSQQRKLSVAGKSEGTQERLGHAPLNITLVMLLWHVELKTV